MNAWSLTPRDPMVMGDGRPLERQRAQVWPVPATLVAAINRWAWDASSDRPSMRAELRASRLRGPLLSDGEQLWVPPPADARRAWDDRAAPWVGGALVSGEDGLWPDEHALPRVFQMEERGQDSRALNGVSVKRPPVDGAAPWAATLSWALGQPDGVVGGEKVWKDEARMHVGIDPGEAGLSTGTAAQGLLFRSAGTRLMANFRWAFDWQGPALGQARAVGLGGEGRSAWLEPHEASPFPAWDAVEALFADAPDEAWLRVQLLTPGLFAGAHPWAPDWLMPRANTARHAGLSLVAMTLDRPLAFSGWRHERADQSGGRVAAIEPRAVRRCVPAGAVYWLGDAQGEPLRREALREAAQRLWLAPFDDPDSPASRQGFGLALPGYTRIDKERS